MIHFNLRCLKWLIRFSEKFKKENAVLTSLNLWLERDKEKKKKKEERWKKKEWKKKKNGKDQGIKELTSGGNFRTEK